MDGDAAEVMAIPKSPSAPKVHDAICCELMKISDKIISILPAIESARPGSSSGIQVLCSLNNTIEKTKSLVCYCAESSKLYLAITAEFITLRCERILTYFNQSLHQVQTMVPLLLASKISEVLNLLRDVKFIVDPGEDEAGKALLNLLAQTDSSEDQEFQVFHFVTSRLNINSAIALLVERRSIKKLLDKLQGVDENKERQRILKYFLYLIKKYGSLIELKPDSMEYKENAYTKDNCLNVIYSESDAFKISGTDLPHPNNVGTQSKETALVLWQSSLNNSISSLKNVSTALSDETKGDCLHESELMKTSAVSFGANCSSHSSPINDQLFSWSVDYQRYQSFSNFSQDMYLRFLFELSGLPTLLQEKVVGNLKNILEGDDEVTFCGMLSNGFAEALVLFLKKSHILCDVPAQRCGAHIFLALMNNKRWELTSLNEESFQLMSSFLNFGINNESLMILQKLVHRPDCISHIVASSIPLDLVHCLYSGDDKYVEMVVKILSELSFHGEMRSLFLSSKFIETLGELLSDRRLVKLCLNILHNLFDDDDDEASRVIADANGCITSIAAVLESGNHEEQEQAVTILLVLCSRSLRNCLLVLKEEVIIPSLVDISVNGNAKGKENSMKLLYVLRDILHSDCVDNPASLEHPMENSKKLLPNYKYFGFFSRKMKCLTKSLALSR